MRARQEAQTVRWIGKNEMSLEEALKCADSIINGLKPLDLDGQGGVQALLD